MRCDILFEVTALYCIPCFDIFILSPFLRPIYLSFFHCVLRFCFPFLLCLSLFLSLFNCPYFCLLLVISCSFTLSIVCSFFHLIAFLSWGCFLTLFFIHRTFVLFLCQFLCPCSLLFCVLFQFFITSQSLVYFVCLFLFVTLLFFFLFTFIFFLFAI